MKLGMFDRLAMNLAPKWGADRIRGKMMMNFLESDGYVVPGSPRKAMKGVTARDNSPRIDMAGKLRGSRALSRDLFMNSPVAVSILRRVRTNVAGSGLVLQSRPDMTFLGMDAQQAQQWEQHVEREFDTWARSKRASWSGELDFFEMQGLAVLSAFMNGDVGYMLPWRRDASWPWELKVKLIEADLIRTPDEIVATVLPGGRDIVGGVEHRGGRLYAYHVSNCYPNEYVCEDGIKKSIEVPAYDANGRRNLWLMANFERVGQRRGMPFLAPVLEALKQLTRLSEAELMAALVSSFFTVFIKDMSGLGSTLQEAFVPPDAITGGGGSDPDAPQNAKNPESAYDYEMGYGNVLYLDEDKEIQVADPRRTNDAFAPFFSALVEQVSAAAEIPPELVMLKFSSSYSAARGALLEAWKFWRTRRDWLSRNFCQPIYEEFLTESIVKGRIVAPGFFDDPVIRAAWSKSSWIGPGNGQIDPLKEAKAAVVKINNNLSTHEEEYMADRGGRWEGAMERKAMENETLARLGLESNPDASELVGPDGQEDEQDDASQNNA